MSSDIFRYKQFAIKHDTAVMKVGTDGVLIGAAVKCEDAKSVLDIGTGTGLIALMIAQKSDANIVAIDINIKAVELAKYNIQESDWSDRMQVYHTRLQDFYPKHSFDLIVSNPPFFQTHIIAPNRDRAIARHALELSIKDVVDFSVKHLSNSGRLVVIYPTEQTKEFVNYAETKGMYVKSQLMVRPKYGYDIVRIITEMSNLKTEYKETEIYIEKDTRHDYTNEYMELTKEYYLKF